MRWHLGHAAFLAITVRVALSALVLATAGTGGSGRSAVFGADIALYAIALTVVLGAIDRRRLRTNDLMANLGYSGIELTAWSAIPPVVLEVAIRSAVALV